KKWYLQYHFYPPAAKAFRPPPKREAAGDRVAARGSVTTRSARLLLLLIRRGARPLLPLREELAIAFLVEVRDRDPRVRHLVRRAVADAHPLIRVGVVLVVFRVVVPRGQDDLVA